MNNLAGFALKFDGVDDTATTRRAVQDTFTIEAWISTTTSRGGPEFYEGLPLIYADQSSHADDFGATILNDHFCFGIGALAQGRDYTFESATKVTTGEWVHVAAVRNATTTAVQLFVNGVEERYAITSSSAPLVAQSTLSLGGGSDGRFFKGRMDEVRIWSVARTEEEIKTTMHRRLQGNEPGLVNYFRLDDGVGDLSVDDASGNDLTLGVSANSKPSWVISDASLL